MKNHVLLTQITLLMTCISIIAIFIFHYIFTGEEATFWCNFFLGVFGSSLLTMLTAIIGYFEEKRHIMESFFYSTYSLLNIISRYDTNWDLEKKIDFFINYDRIDKSQWDLQLGSMYFMLGFNKKTIKYIKESIYIPLIEFNSAVASRRFNFMWHKDGTGKNDIVMADFVEEIESIFVEKKQITNTWDDGNESTTTYIKNKLVESITHELNGKYHRIMYPKSQNN